MSRFFKVIIRVGNRPGNDNTGDTGTLVGIRQGFKFETGTWVGMREGPGQE